MAEPRGSFGRCLIFKSNFFERFYEVFFASDPRIPQLFSRTDMVKQRDVLRQALTMLIMFENGSEVAAGVLSNIGWTHGQRGLHITPELYGIWKKALIRVVAESDPEYSPAIEARWHEAIDKGISYILVHQEK